MKAPPGVKKNLLRTFEAWSPEYVSKSGSASRSQALFVLAWFHAIVQERRIFIPQVQSISALCTWHVNYTMCSVNIYTQPLRRSGQHALPSAPEDFVSATFWYFLALPILYGSEGIMFLNCPSVCAYVHVCICVPGWINSLAGLPWTSGLLLALLTTASIFRLAGKG